MRLGKECGLEGMFNCSFILKKNQHYLIEADARPNSWHFLYSHFKIPILEIMSEKIPMPTTPYIANLKNSEIELIDLDRAIPYAALKRNHKLIFYSYKNSII